MLAVLREFVSFTFENLSFKNFCFAFDTFVYLFFNHANFFIIKIKIKNLKTIDKTHDELQYSNP